VLSLKLNIIFRRIVLLGGPLLLGILEVWHPASVVFGDMVTSPEMAEWWLTLHIIQLPLFGLLAAAMYFILDGVQNVFATISRIALWFFIVFYTALDSIAGIATGILFNKVQSLNLTNVDDPLFNTMYDLFFAIFILDFPGGSIISQIAVFSWFIVGLSAATALYIKGVNRVGVILIALATVVFHSHAYPNGTISMFLLTAGLFLIEFFPWKFTEIKNPSLTKQNRL
jgi:hypothetical protein